MNENEKLELCENEGIHEDIVQFVKAKLQPAGDYEELANLLKLFGDPTRVKLLHALEQHEMCVCDISVLLGMTKSSVSHQLRVLKQSNLVKNRKVGRVVYYALADEHVETIFSAGMEHILE